MKNILIIGAYGFIGSYLVKYFEKQGVRTVKIGHSSNIEENRDVTITNLNNISDVDYIINCAGSGDVKKSLHEPMLDFENNVYLLVKILEYVKNSNNKPKIIQLSSAAVYGVVPDKAIKEDSVLNPISPYGYHKKIAEELCESYCKFFGLDITVIRLFSVYGNGLRKQLFWDACNKFEMDEQVSFFGTGKETRDFIHIDDTCVLIDKSLEHLSGFNIINGGVGRRVELNYVISLIAKEFNKEYIFNNQIKEGDPKYYLADIMKMNDISFIPRVTLEDGIKKYVEWYKKSKK